MAWRSSLDACCSTLRPDERDRAGRFREGAARERYQSTRGILRLLLGRYLGTNPIDVIFAYNTHGKPELVRKSPALHFNVSHSADQAAFAFSHRSPVGVDIERVRVEMARRDEIASRHFAPSEHAAIKAAPTDDAAGAFFRCWSRKEAVLKARGDGIFGGLQSFAVNVDAGPARVVEIEGNTEAASRWQMFDLPPFREFVGAVALMPIPGLSSPRSGIMFYIADPELLVAGAR